MKVSDLFYLTQGNGFELVNMNENSFSEINFVSRTSQNNGVVAKVDEIERKKPFDSGLITVALSGNSVLSSFVQVKPFYTSFHVMVLCPKNKDMTFIEKLYYCRCIKKNAYKYSWGRQANKTLKDLDLPDKLPDEISKMKINYNLLDTITVNENMNVDVSKWQSYKFGGEDGIFEIKKGFYNKKPEHFSDGNIPFIGAVDNSNGVTEYYSQYDIEVASKTGNGKNEPIEKKIFPPHALVVTNNGSVGFAYYQNKSFTCSHDVNPLYLKSGKFNKYTALFVATVIMQDRYRWSYGRKWRPDRMKDSYWNCQEKCSLQTH